MWVRVWLSCSSVHWLQVLVRVLDHFESKPSEFYLLDTVFINKADATHVVQALLATMTKAGIKNDNIVAYVSDNAPYIKASFTTLKVIWPNAIHITCFAHIMSLVGDVARIQLSDLDTFVGSVKMVFSKSVERRTRFKEVMTDGGVENPTLPPWPCHTRWNTW